jgi:hypothetical protein
MHVFTFAPVLNMQMYVCTPLDTRLKAMSLVVARDHQLASRAWRRLPLAAVSSLLLLSTLTSNSMATAAAPITQNNSDDDHVDENGPVSADKILICQGASSSNCVEVDPCSADCSMGSCYTLDHACLSNGALKTGLLGRTCNLRYASVPSGVRVRY